MEVCKNLLNVNIYFKFIVMPQLYSKIINNKKYEEDCEPLKESQITNNTI